MQVSLASLTSFKKISSVCRCILRYSLAVSFRGQSKSLTVFLFLALQIVIDRASVSLLPSPHSSRICETWTPTNPLRCLHFALAANSVEKSVPWRFAISAKEKLNEHLNASRKRRWRITSLNISWEFYAKFCRKIAPFAGST